jgi:hypothetical protein
VTASAEGHETRTRNVPVPGVGEFVISLSGVLVYGKVADAVSGRPVGGAEVSVALPGGTPAASAHTDESGNFVFKLIPENAEIAIEDDVYGSATFRFDASGSLLIELDPPPVAGVVVDPTGKPIEGVEVSSARSHTRSGDDGMFFIEGVGQGEELTLTSDLGRTTVLVEGVDLGEIVLREGENVPATPRDDAS